MMVFCAASEIGQPVWPIWQHFLPLIPISIHPYLDPQKAIMGLLFLKSSRLIDIKSGIKILYDFLWYSLTQ